MKDKLKQELLNKLKPGIKPSDLKKIPDEGYESETDSHQSSVKNQGKDPIKNKPVILLDEFERENPETVSQVAEKALIEANQKIRELQEKNKSLNQTITELKNQPKTPTKTTPELFTCSHCQQEWNQEFIRLIDKQGKKTCSECVENMLELTKQATGQEIVIEKQVKSQPAKPCQFCSKPYPQSQLKPRHIKNLPNKDSREITLLCQDCLIYRAIKADLICPRISSGRDTYEGNEFDCYCPTNERRNY